MGHETWARARARRGRRWARIVRALVLALAPGFIACASRAPEPPCDPATIAAKLAECTMRVRNCEPFPAPCPAEDECIRWVDEREAECTGVQ